MAIARKHMAAALQRPPQRHSMGIATSLAHAKLAILLVLGIAVLYSLADVPYAAIVVVDVLFCAYLASLFNTKYKYLFLLHPTILLISSQLFVTSFLDAGDGGAYQTVVAQYLNTQDLTINVDNLLSTLKIFGFLRYTSLGVVPIYAVPELFFGNPADEIYYLWQGTFHVVLCTVAITLAHAWRVLDSKYLFSMVLFAVLAPSFFDLGAAPTRHIVTFFGVFLLCITHLAVMQRITATRAIWFAAALVVILISKAPLLLPYMIFVAVDLFFIQRTKINVTSILLAAGLVLGILVMGAYLYQITLAYEEMSTEGAATFGKLTKLPIIGYAVKYVYALLAPFPWSEAPFFTATNYAGNGLLFLMHVLSSLTGLYLFFAIILNGRAILTAEVELKQVIFYGLIMSLSILKGATGFHTYLLIYFPMFAPLLTIRRFRINPLLPLGFVVLIESIVLIGK